MLFANPEDRFSRVVAQLKHYVYVSVSISLAGKMDKILHIKLVLLVVIYINVQGQTNSDKLRVRMYHMESLLRDDIGVLRELLKAETEERRAFQRYVDEFMEHTNSSTLSKASPEVLKGTYSIEDMGTRVMILQKGIHSMKKHFKENEELVHHLVKEVEHLSESMVAITKSIAKVSDTCSAVYASVCGCEGWHKYGDQCYEFFNDRLTWQEAQTHCGQYDGHLAVIYDQETNDYLAGNATLFEYFIDGTDLNDEGQWKWKTTGEIIQYSNWIDGQPDNYKDLEHCLVLCGTIHKGRWNDMPCHMSIPFICQRPCTLR